MPSPPLFIQAALTPALPSPTRSWLGLANPFETALGFAVLVLVVEGVTFADMTPRQISQYLSGVSASSSDCTAPARLHSASWWRAPTGARVVAATAAFARPPQGWPLAAGLTPVAAVLCICPLPCLPQSDAGIQGLSPGDATIAFLAAKRQQLKLLNAALLAVLSLASRAVDAASAALIGVPVGCLSLLLLSSTVASGVRQASSCRACMLGGRALHVSPPLVQAVHVWLPLSTCTHFNAQLNLQTAISRPRRAPPAGGGSESCSPGRPAGGARGGGHGEQRARGRDAREPLELMSVWLACWPGLKASLCKRRARRGSAGGKNV